MFDLVGSSRMFGSIAVNATRIYQIHACVNLREFHVDSGDFLLQFGNLEVRSYGFRTKFARTSYESGILVKFAGSARDIRTNFVRICRIRTNFARISQIQAQLYRGMIPEFSLGDVWA